MKGLCNNLDSDFILIQNNIFEKGGISLSNSNHNEILENTISKSSGASITISNGKFNRISGNYLYANNYAIFISSDSSSSTITYNTIEGNTIGVGIFGSNTTLALNNFIENAQQGTISGSPIFLNSTSQIPYTYQNRTYTRFLGNYWSDYRDTDSNNDGIWDNPNTLGSGIDYAPLVGRWNGTAISQQVPPRILTVGPAGCNFTRIQDAVSNASTGDIIQIMSGIYPEQIVLKKRLTLQGINTGSGQPQITGSISSGTAISLLTGLTKISNINISGFGTGITIQSNGNTIENSTILTTNQGLTLSSANDNKLVNNTILYPRTNSYSSGDSGIYLLSSSRNTIANNTVQYWYRGIYSLLSENNAISSNHIVSNQEYGIYLNDNRNSRISHNLIEKNSYGIQMYSWNSPSGNNITENTLANNTDYGIYISGDGAYDQISLNNFINNKNSYQSTRVVNTWNTLTPLLYRFKNTTFTNYLGNYWSDYTGTDANGDGIGDTPYTAVTDPDNYPLMGTWNGTGITQERPQPIITPTPTPPTPTPIPPESWGILTLPNATIANQTTKLIPVKISRFNGIASGVSFELVYNKSVMQVLGFVTSDAVPGSSIIANINNNQGEASVALTNVLGISAYSINPTVLLFINATAVGAVNDTTPLTARAVTASDAQFTLHNLTIGNGQITIVVDVKGDFNHNGRVDIGDVAMVSYMVVNREPKLIPDADFNNNGDVDIGDAAKIAYYFVGLVREL
ncbi:MAG: right-handed parallel beta-helix repeat-containing protein [Methanoregula sp.]|nr:right-handed parallel beta-helix repeat-containing protein [Methanoregula sp.]